MRSRQTTGFLVLLCLLLFAFAYSPLFQAGLTAPDVAVLIEGSTTLPPDEWGDDPEAIVIDEKPLTRASLVLSRTLWGLPKGDGGATALFLRLENLFLLVLAAVGLGCFARRLLLPWSGSEQATAAAQSATLFFGLYPLATAAVAQVSSRGDLLALVFATWAAALFLRGRQDRQVVFTGISLALCILGGFSSDLVLGLPLLLCASEFVSAHRYRPLRVRLRTAFTTLLIFGAAAVIDLVVSTVRYGTAALPPGIRELQGVSSVPEASQQLVRAIEKLGLLVLPANPEVLGLAGWALAGTVFLLAMQPALVAARSAPRLWGWLLFGWFASLFVSELLHAHVRVTPRELSLARSLLPSAAVMTFGLALGATALSGPRRPYIAWVVAIGYACLAHGNALPWRHVAVGASVLRVDLQETLETFGRDARILVLDPPAPEGGVDPIGNSVAWLAHPVLDGLRGEELPDVRSLSTEAFLVLVREPEFSEMRGNASPDEPLIVLTPPDPEGGPGRRDRWIVAAPQPSVTPPQWRATLRSPDMDLEALDYAALVVTAPVGSDLEALRQVSWLTRGPEKGSHEGVWLTGSEELTGVFDLGASLAWRRSGRIRSMLFEEGTGSIGKGDPLQMLPSLVMGPPETRGEDWVFGRPETALVKAAAGRGRYVFVLLDLATLQLRELGVVVGDGELRVRGAAADVDDVLQRGGGPLAWSLDYRIGESTVSRSRGRVE